MLFGQYFFKSPFRLLREFDEQHPDQMVGPYGETDLYAFEKLLERFSIPKTDTFADLGSGRGRVCFWLRCVRGQSRVVGIEREKRMVERAVSLCRLFRIAEVTFQFGDWEKMPLRGIDVFYLYGPMMSDGRIERVAQKLKDLPVGTKIITVSGWLGEVMPSRFQLIKTLPIRFPWGETEAFLQVVSKDG